MNKKQSAYVTMHGKSSNLIDEDPDKFASNPTTPEAKTRLDKSMADEKQLAQKQDEIEHSSNVPKAESHDAVASNIYQTGSKIGSFAFDTHNVDLQSKVSISLSELKKLPDNLFISRCETILGCGEQYLPQLPLYLVTESTLAEGQDLLDAFELEIKKQGQRKIERSSVTQQLNKQIKTTNKLFEPFDAQVETQRLSDPVWYNLWWDARSLPQTPKARISVKLKVYDAETNQPLPGTILTYSKIETNGKALTSGPDLSKIVKVKSAGGGLDLKSLTTGAYLFTASYAGRVDMQTTVYVNEGVLTRVEFPLSKVA